MNSESNHSGTKTWLLLLLTGLTVLVMAAVAVLLLPIAPCPNFSLAWGSKPGQNASECVHCNGKGRLTFLARWRLGEMPPDCLAEYEGRVISDLRGGGLVHESWTKIRDLSGLKIGDRLTTARTSEAHHRIWSTHSFQFISFHIDEDPTDPKSKIMLTINLWEAGTK